MEKYVLTNAKPLDVEAIHQSKKYYKSPSLQVFGKIAALTQSASGNCQGDNTTGCGTPGANMAMA